MAGDINTGATPGVVFNSLPTTVRQRYTAQITYWTGIQLQADAQLTKLLGSVIEEYDFSAGDGRTKVKRRDIIQLMAVIDTCEKKIRWYEMKLYGRGLSTLALRRKS